MVATFVGRLKRTALLALEVSRKLRPCLVRRWRYVETKDRCCGNQWESPGREEPDTESNQDIRCQVASARSASARRTHLRGAQIHLRELQHQKLFETSALNKIPPRDPCRSPSCQLIRPRCWL